MLSASLAGLWSNEIFSIVYIELRVLRVPVGVSHLLVLQQVFLWLPEVGVTVRVLCNGVWSHVLRDVYLIFSHQVVDTGVSLVLEEGEGHSQVVVRVHSNGQLSWNGIPGVLVHLPDRSIPEDHHGHLIVGGCWP